jgi:hypothetical protein
MESLDHRIASPFTSLPGELRNLVYEAVLAMETPGHIVHVHHRRPKPKDNLVPCCMRHRERKFAGLIHASRVVRYEFQPLYLVAMQLHVPIDEVPHYLGHFPTADLAHNIMVSSVLETLKARVLSFMRQPIHLKPLLAIHWSQ